MKKILLIVFCLILTLTGCSNNATQKRDEEAEKTVTDFFKAHFEVDNKKVYELSYYEGEIAESFKQSLENYSEQSKQITRTSFKDASTEIVSSSAQNDKAKVKVKINLKQLKDIKDLWRKAGSSINTDNFQADFNAFQNEADKITTMKTVESEVSLIKKDGKWLIDGTDKKSNQSIQKVFTASFE